MEFLIETIKVLFSFHEFVNGFILSVSSSEKLLQLFLLISWLSIEIFIVFCGAGTTRT